MTEALAMGGYGAYVWSCFALTLIVLVACVLQGRRKHRQTYNEIRMRLQALEPDQ